MDFSVLTCDDASQHKGNNTVLNLDLYNNACND